MSGYIIGIDGGGTKTRGMIADLNGEVHGYKVVGSSNYHALGLEQVEQNLRELIDFLTADRSLDDLKYVCLGLSGVGRPVDHERIGSVLEKLGVKDRAYLTNDAVTALVGGALAEFGILIIAGTGSIVYAMDGKGNMARAGGYGQYLADEGSGYRIGLKGLRAIMKAFDGRIPETSISKPVLKKLGVESPMELVTWIGGLDNLKEGVGNVGPFVLQAAEEGDEASSHIIHEEVGELIVAVKAVVNRLNMAEQGAKIDVVLVGGVLENSDFYFKKLSEGINAALPFCNPTKPKAPAAIGACIAALRKIDIEPDDTIIKNLQNGLEKFAE